MQPSTAPRAQRLNVYPRWRPLTKAQHEQGEIERSRKQSGSRTRISIAYRGGASSSKFSSNKTNSWTSNRSFTSVFETSVSNDAVFEAVVRPTLPHILTGNTCNFFAYGHTGSGKTHTVIGSNEDGEEVDRMGLYLCAAKWLVEALENVNSSAAEGSARLGLGMRLYELRHKKVYDLLDGKKECYAREGEDGKTHIRGQTEMLEGGKVRVKQIVQKLCWTFDDVLNELKKGLELRATGSSSVHDESSRTHAVLEIEIVNQGLIDAREALVDAESELVPVGKLATDIHVEEHCAALERQPDGSWGFRADRPLNRERIDAAEAEKKKFEGYVEEAKQKVAEVFSAGVESGLGGKIVFVDLAGAEYQTTGTVSSVQTPKQTPQEKQEGRQINTDLLALKEVIRAWSSNQPRIPFRSSTLTMVLREHFLASTSSFSGMILTVSPSTTQFPATMNSLKYGDLVGEVRRN